jgi:hypothetical protein
MIDFGQIFGGNFGGIGGSDIAGAGAAAAAIGGGFLAASGAQTAAAGQARAYTENALTAGENAAQTRFILNRQDQQQGYEINRIVGQQRARYGAAGVLADTGTPGDVLADTEEEARQAAMNRFYAGDYAARSANEQASYDAEAARAAKRAGRTNATADIIGGIGSAAKLAASIFAL